MRVQTILGNGICKDILVRYSPQLNGLFTTVRVLENKGISFSEIEGASAPFKVYRSDWCNSGIIENDDYFSEENLVGEVPYMITAWNYR